MLFNYPKNWILVVKFLKTFIQPRSLGFVCIAANSIRPIRYSPGYYASVSREKEK